MKFLKFSTLILTFLFSSTVAFAQTSDPTQCPSIASIKTAGLSYAEEADDGYGVYAENDYDTPYHWVFMIGPIVATSNQDAFTQGVSLLNQLSGTPTPQKDSQNRFDQALVCTYQVDLTHQGLAVNWS